LRCRCCQPGLCRPHRCLFGGNAALCLTVGECDARFDLLAAAGNPGELRVKRLDTETAFPVVDPDQNPASLRGIAIGHFKYRHPTGNPAAHGNNVGGDTGIRHNDMGELLIQPPAATSENDQRRQDRAIPSPWPRAGRR